MATAVTWLTAIFELIVDRIILSVVILSRAFLR